MTAGKPFIELLEVDSTNNYAMAQVQASLAVAGTAWFAHKQTSGKGQRGKTWFSKEKENIILSIVIDPAPLTIANQFALSALCTLACVDLIGKYTTTAVKIKWPNDLYIGDRKAGGILIENVLQGDQWKFSVVGIGINVNQIAFSDDVPNATSLAAVTGNTFDPPLLARQLCVIFENMWQRIERGGTEEIIQEYNQKLFKLNELVDFKIDNAVLSAKVLGVNFIGELILDTGEEITIPNGQISWLLPS